MKGYFVELMMAFVKGVLYMCMWKSKKDKQRQGQSTNALSTSTFDDHPSTRVDVYSR